VTWERRKSEPKSAKKRAIFLFAIFSFSSPSTVAFSHHHPHHRSSHHQLHHRKPTQPPNDHQEPLSVSLSSLQPLLRVFFLLLLPLPQATIFITASATVSTTNRPPKSHCDSLPLLLPASLSPLQLFLLPLIADASLHRCNHWQHTVILGRPPPRQVVCPLSPSPSSSSSLPLFTHEQWAWIIIHVHCSCSGLYLFFQKFF